MKKADKSTWFLNVIFNRLPFYLNALWAILSHKKLQKILAVSKMKTKKSRELYEVASLIADLPHATQL